MSKNTKVMATKFATEYAKKFPEQFSHEKLVLSAEEKFELENWKREKRTFCDKVIMDLSKCRLKLSKDKCSGGIKIQKEQLMSNIKTHLDNLTEFRDYISKYISIASTMLWNSNFESLALSLMDDCVDKKWDNRFFDVKPEISQIVDRILDFVSIRNSFAAMAADWAAASSAASFGCVVEAAGGAGAMSSAASFGETCDESSASKAIRKAKHNKSKKNKKKNGPSTASVTLAASSMAASEDLNLATISSSEKDTLSGRSSSSEEKHSHSFVETLKLERKQSFASISSDSSSDEEVDYHLPPRSYAEKIAASDRRIGESPGLSFLVSQ